MLKWRGDYANMFVAADELIAAAAQPPAEADREGEPGREPRPSGELITPRCARCTPIGRGLLIVS
jgi:hypothetical protein